MVCNVNKLKNILKVQKQIVSINIFDSEMNTIDYGVYINNFRNSHKN